MAGLMRQRRFLLVTITSSVVMMTLLHIVTGRSLPVDCTSQQVVLRHTWRHPCRGSTELSISVSDAVTEAATPVPVERTTHQLRLLKQDSVTAERKAMRLKTRYVTGSSRIDGLTAAVLEERFSKSPEFPDLPPLTLVSVRCNSTSVASSDDEAVDNEPQGMHFQQTRAIIHEECNEPIPLSESLMRIQHDVDTMLCRLHQIVYPRSIASLLSNHTLQALERISHSYEQPLVGGSSSIPRYWVDYLLLRDIVNSMRVLKHLYANLIDYNC